nr:hypothetical protein [uncultured bacterium]
MARPISWLPRLHAIRQSVANSIRSHYDRHDLEDLFGIGNRAAQELFKCLPTTRVGQSFLVAKEDLSELLDGIHGAADPAAHLAVIRENSPGRSRKKLRVLVRKDQTVATLDSLPDNLSLERGRLTVSFQTSQELAVTLYGIAQILEEELEEFERRYQKLQKADDSISPEKLDLQRLLRELDDIEHKRN